MKLHAKPISTCKRDTPWLTITLYLLLQGSADLYLRPQSDRVITQLASGRHTFVIRTTGTHARAPAGLVTHLSYRELLITSILPLIE